MFLTGFSLTELMVVIAIVGILSVVAVPAYQSYITRADISAIESPAYEAIKMMVTDYYMQNGIFPEASNLGLAASDYTVTDPTAFGNDIARIDIASGVNCATVVIVIPGADVGANFTDTWNYLPNTTNDLVYTNQIYDNGSTLLSLCGTQSNVAADYSYLPPECGYDDGTGFGPMGTFPTNC